MAWQTSFRRLDNAALASREDIIDGTVYGKGNWQEVRFETNAFYL